MAVKNTAKVLIGGKVITLGGYESEEYLVTVASFMNKKISELSEIKGYTRLPMETKHMLLSLNIADEYFKAKKKADAFDEDSQRKDQEVYTMRHEMVELKMELEKVRQELAEAEANAKSMEEQNLVLEEKNKELEKEIDELIS